MEAERGAASAEQNGNQVSGTESARSAGLRYVTDKLPGIRRKRAGKGFAYIDPAGKSIREVGVTTRIRALAIPPAWNDVWICPIVYGHLQATGRDARGRKQYRYHPRWRQVRDEAKFDRMSEFGKALPGIRTAIKKHLKLEGLPREKVLATIISLLERTYIRVGNDEYARSNHSFGLTTLRGKHVRIRGRRVEFQFRGKGAKRYSIQLEDERLARIVKRCRELPGYELFQYVNGSGEPQSIDSGDVNDYLREIGGADFSAKDFRTWGGTVLALAELSKLPQSDSAPRTKRNIVRAIERVAERLGNTVAVCRSCYVHPAIISAYLEGSLPRTIERYRKRSAKGARIRMHEWAVLAIVRRG